MVLEETPQGSISYSYDAIGRRISMTVAGQAPVAYNWDAASRLTSVTQGAQTVTMSYDSASRRTSLALPNGVQTSYAYDPASRVKQILHHKASSTLENIQYQYDPTGSRTSYQRTSPHPPLPDELGATFDSANEMLSLGDLSGQGGASFQYDANGNLATRTDSCGTTTYSWDGRNRLTGMSGHRPDCSPLTAGFKYDALGRRTEKTINGQTTQYLYDGLDVAAELQGGSVTATYLRSLSIDEPFARTKGGTASYYLQDGLGSVIGLTDTSGGLTTIYAYDAFGGTTATGAASDQPFKYTGREDDGTGLYYYRARYYSPEMRRFVSEDPIGLKGGDLNLYGYVGQDPINWVDDLGLARKTSEGGWADCNEAETAECVQDCANAGKVFESCKVWVRVYTTVRDGKPWPATKRASKPSCSCKDNCDANGPTPLPILIPPPAGARGGSGSGARGGSGGGPIQLTPGPRVPGKAW